VNPPQIAFPALLQSFFQQRLVAQRGLSAQTVASYRDTFQLLLRYAQQVTRRSPSALVIEDLDVPLVLAFLDHLEIQHCLSPNASWRSRPSASTGRRSSSFHARRSKPSLMLPIAVLGAVSVTQYCWPRSTIPAPASRRSQGYGSKMY
jgi:hypothetical protein